MIGCMIKIIIPFRSTGNVTDVGLLQMFIPIWRHSNCTLTSPYVHKRNTNPFNTSRKVRTEVNHDCVRYSLTKPQAVNIILRYA